MSALSARRWNLLHFDELCTDHLFLLSFRVKPNKTTEEGE